MQTITLWIVTLVTVSGCASYDRSPEPVTIDGRYLCTTSGYKPGGSESIPYCDQFFAKTPSNKPVQQNQGVAKREPLKKITPRMQEELDKLKKRLEKL